MAGKIVKTLDPLTWTTPIVDAKSGLPSPEFQRKWQQLLAVASTTLASVSAMLDLITATRGSILYRGLTGWAGRAPGALNTVLTSNGPGQDPTYKALPPMWTSFIVVDATHYYVAMGVSLADPELVMAGGVPVYVLNPGFTP